LVKNGSKEIVPGIPKIDFYVHREFAEDELLPWEIVKFGVKRTLLEREYDKCLNEDVSVLISRAKKSKEMFEQGSKR